MKKYIYIFLLFAPFLFLTGCEDKLSIDEEEYLSALTVYNQKNRIVSASAWIAAKTELFHKRDTITYLEWKNPTTSQNEVLAIKGFVSGDNIEIGNIMLSLYGEGLSVNEQTKMTEGSGLCLSLHLRTQDVSEITPGEYTYSKETNSPFVFTGYYSSNYSPYLNTNNIAEIKSGTVTIVKEDKKYTITANCTVAAGIDVSCTYVGEIDKIALKQNSFVYHKGVRLKGIIKFPFKTTSLLPANPYVSLRPDDWWIFYDPAINPRTNSNPSFSSTETSSDASSPGILDLSKSTGTTATASTSTTVNQTLNESQSIVLIYDAEDKELSFISPLSFINYITTSTTILIDGNRRPRYILPCHTEYMMAPISFTQEEFDNYSVEDFPKNFKDEPIKIKASNDEFTAKFIFFKDGNGTKGIIRVRELIMPESDYEVLIIGTIISSTAQRKPTSPYLTLDIKYPGVPTPNPKIR